MSDSQDQSKPRSVETVFQAARALEGTERAAYLDRVCVDEGFRARAEALLAAHEQQSGFLPSGDSIETRTGMPSVTEEVGTVIGRYKLLELLGEGGFGSVWAAEQREPVRRRVALKIVKLGMDTKQVVGRFEAERQALAMMDHPNIAKVLDAGTTDTGRPFFVMELVKGIPITKFFEQEGTEISEKLTLFIKVCQAIQHAHQKGIIHRDIKPSNVMVTLHDGEPVPKVIDFGIAKATQGDLTDKTIYTQYSQFIGTPAYMSPEQAEMSGLDVDTRSDIYSLGVLLYEILTGTTPFETKALLASGLDEMRRIIREQEPVRPSTRVSESVNPDGEGGIRMRRQQEALPQMRGDLDWIVMKCLEKDRARRYDTANGLAMDIERHLGDEPIVARPPSTFNRMAKAWRRHRTAFSAAAAVALALAAGLMLSLKETARANRESAAATEARDSAESSKAALAEEVERVKEARQETEAALEQARANEREAERNLYAADMRLAFLALNENHYAKVRRIVKPYVTQDNESTSLGWEGRYLWKTVHETQHLDVLEGHSALVSAAVFLGNNQQVVTGSDDQTIRIWDLRTKRFRELEAAQGRFVKSLVASLDGHFVAAEWGGVKDLKLSSGIGVWDVRTGELLASVEAAVTGNGTRGLAFLPNSTEIIYRDNLRSMLRQQGRVIRLDWETGVSEVVADNLGELGALVLSDDGERVLYCNNYDVLPREVSHTDSEHPNNSGYDLRVLGGKNRVTRFPLPVGERSNAAGMSPDGRIVAIGLWYDPIVMLLDAQSGERIGELRGHNAWISCIQFSPDGETIYTSSGDHTIRVWDVATQTQRAVLRGHDDEVWDIQFSPDRKTVVSASKDSTAKIWAADVVDYEEPVMGFLQGYQYQDTLIEGPRTTLVALEKGPSPLIIFFEVSREIQMELNSLRVPGGPVHAAGFVPGEDTLMVMQSEGVSLWDWRRRILVKKLEPFDRPIDTGRVFSPRYLGSLGATAVCFELNQANAGPLGDISYFWKDAVNDDRLILNPVRDLAIAPFRSDFEPMSRTRAIGTVEGMILLQSTGDPSQTFEFRAHKQNVNAVAFSSDGNRLYSAGTDGYVSVWDWRKRESIGEPMRSQLMSVDVIAVSPDQQRLVTCDAHGGLTIWDLERRRELGTIHLGRTRRFRHIRFITNQILIGLSYHFVLKDTKWHVWSASDWDKAD